MSVEAMAWALNTAPVADQGQLLVLLGLANHAGPKGEQAWPSVGTLAKYARCSERSVQRHLKALEASSLIRRGDPGWIPSKVPNNRRPVVYDLNMAGFTGATQVSPQFSPGVTPDVPWGDSPGTSGVTPVSDKPSFFLTEETTQEPLNARARKTDSHDQVTADFDAFWERYPRRVGKGAALTAYRKARKTTDADILLKAVTRYPFDRERPQYVPHPATWLNQQRWLDEVPALVGASAGSTPARPGVRYYHPTYNEETGTWT